MNRFLNIIDELRLHKHNVSPKNNAFSYQKLVDFRPDKIKGKASNAIDQFLEDIKNSSARKDIMLNTYGIELKNVCFAFKEYTDGRIKQLEDEVDASDLIAGLVSTLIKAIPVASFAFTPAVSIAQRIAHKITNVIKTKFMGAISRSSKSDSLSALRKSVRELLASANDISTSMRYVIQKEFKDAMMPYINKLNSTSNTPLTNEDLEVLDKLHVYTDEELTTNLIKYFGIPDTRDLVELHLRLFEQLVYKFEIYHANSLSRKTQMAYLLGVGRNWDKHKASRETRSATVDREWALRKELKYIPRITPRGYN